MRRAFELLKTRKIEDSIDISALESSHGILIPDMYRLFAETFTLGKDCISFDLYFHPKYKDERYVSYFSYAKMPEIEFAGFNTPENAIIYSKDIEDKEDIEYLTIGYNTIGGIALGLKGDKKDVVFLYNPNRNPEYTRLCDDIFEFVRGLEEILQPEEDLDGVRFDQLYKNWGDKNWQVRES